jgi:hypothetical protein
MPENGDDQIRSLLETVEEIRARSYSHLPADLVESILIDHRDATSVDTNLKRKLEDLVEQLVDSDS